MQRKSIVCSLGLPDEEGRVQILEIHTAKMREHKLLAPDVDLADLAVQTKNFTGAEIEGLVRAAQSTAMNRFIQVQQKYVRGLSESRSTMSSLLVPLRVMYNKTSRKTSSGASFC